MTHKARLPLPPVGVCLAPREVPKDLSRTVVTSFCDAVRRATRGGPVLIDSNSVDTCKWSPPVLGLKGAATEFERSLSPRLEFPAGPILVARLGAMPEGLKPDVVILRGPLSELRVLLESVGEGKQALEFVDPRRVDKSALGLLRDGDRLDGRVNRWTRNLLGRLRTTPGWQPLTTLIFKSTLATRAFDQVIKRTMADMSMCRNSVVIPHLTGKANLSFFCTGGIAWGLNDPKHMTSGWPVGLYREIEPLIEFA